MAVEVSRTTWETGILVSKIPPGEAWLLALGVVTDVRVGIQMI